MSNVVPLLPMIRERDNKRPWTAAMFARKPARILKFKPKPM